MRKLLLLPLLGLVAACGSDGVFKSPADMTAAERCMNLRTLLAIAQTNGASADTLEKMKANIDLLCPVEQPADGGAVPAEGVIPG